MRRRIVIAVALAALIALAGGLAVLWPSPAAAQYICGERDAVVAALKRNHGEKPVAKGVSSAGAVIEILASPDGTFTVILTQPGGPTCLMADGQDWEILPAALGPEA